MDKRIAIFIACTSGAVALFFFGVAEFLADGDDVAESVVHMTRILAGALWSRRCAPSTRQ